MPRPLELLMTTPTEQTVRLTSLSHGAGCACKLPLASLEQLMTALGRDFQPATGDLLVGAAEGDDAAVLRLDDQRALVFTTDFFTPIVNDARDWGRIAAANALSDVYAMGGRPLISLNLTAWPGERLPIELLAEVLRGGAEVAAAAGCLVVGGHTIDDPEPKYGMAVVGLAHPERLLTVDRARPGDLLVLTKPLGTGVVATALKQGAADAETVAIAVEAMTTLNAAASEAAVAGGVRAVTDITGFGLLGHLHRMANASQVSAEVYAASVPFLPGAADLADRGFVSGGTRKNTTYLADVVEIEPEVPPTAAILLHDAQTSGGMLLAIPPDQVDGLLDALQGRGVHPVPIGRMLSGPPGRIRVHHLPPDTGP
jgi:selenide,water dikinase